MTTKKDAAPAAGPHEETWGATEEVKASWEEKNADKVAKAIEKDNERKAAGE